MTLDAKPTRSLRIPYTPVIPYVVDVDTLELEAMTQPTIKTDTVSVDADVTDDSARLVGNVNLYDPQIAKTAKVDPMRQLATSEPIRLVGTSFGGTTKDTNFWTESVTGSGAVTQAGQITLATGSTADSNVEYKSLRQCRYVAGSSNFFRAVIRLPDAGVANNIRRWGSFTTAARVPVDGIWFQLDGTTLGVGYRNNSGTIQTPTPTVALTKDTNAHTYEIWWTNSKIWFYQDDVLKHTVTLTTTPAVQSYSLNCTLQNINSGGITNDLSLECRVSSIYRFGHIETASTYKNITGSAQTVCKYGAGRLHSLVVNNPANKAIIVYDNVTSVGQKIGTVTPLANTSPFTLDYHVNFGTGLMIDTLAGAQDITVIFE